MLRYVQMTTGYLHRKTGQHNDVVFLPITLYFPYATGWNTLALWQALLLHSKSLGSGRIRKYLWACSTHTLTVMHERSFDSHRANVAKIKLPGDDEYSFMLQKHSLLL